MSISHFICSLVDGHLGCFHLLTIGNNAMNVGVQISLWDLLPSPGGINLDVELLGHRVVPFVTIRGTSVVSSTAAAPSEVPTKSTQGFPSLHVLPTLVLFIFLTVTSLLGVRWALTVLLICSLNWVFSCCVLGVLYISWIWIPFQIYDLQIFSLILWVVFLLCEWCLLMNKV